MKVLPSILNCPKLNTNFQKFFTTTTTNPFSSYEMCGFETKLDDIRLPLFSDIKRSYEKIFDIRDSKNARHEVVDKLE
tara:strand:- start:477 stop:710 length:234 start_codon:yes stop_codon:yes gene_type:complete